jgi:hypothetical protein
MSSKAENTQDKTRVYTSCGTGVDPESKFCPECGDELESAKDAKESYLSKKSWLIISIFTSLVALIFIPPVFGLAGVFSGYQVFKTNEEQGIVLMIFGGVCLVGGMLIGLYLV